MSYLLSEKLDSVHVKGYNRPEYAACLTLKISMVGGTGGFGLAVPSNCMLIELSSESDFFLYYSVKLSEPDFHALKADQRLLVEFAQFPNMIKQLVVSRVMSCVLSISESGGAIFSLVEANQFRELVHLSLAMSPGTDEVVKGYLASLLNTYKLTVANLESTCLQLTQDLKQMSGIKITLESEVSNIRSEADLFAQKLHNKHQLELSQLREEHAREIRSLHLSSTSEHSVETRRLGDHVQMMNERSREADKKLEETRLALIASESQLNGYCRQISNLQEQLELAKKSQMEVEHKNSNLLNEQTALKEQLANSQLNHASEAELKKLQTRAKQAKHALKETQNALLQQEAVVLAQTREIEALRAQIGEHNVESAKLKTQLADAQKTAENNSQLATYLHTKRDSNLFARTSLLKDHNSNISSTTQLKDHNSNVSSNYSLLGRSMNHSGGIATPVVVDSYPSRLGNTDSVSRLVGGPVKFTSRSGQAKPLIK